MIIFLSISCFYLASLTWKHKSVCILSNINVFRRSVELYFQRVSDKALSKIHRWGPFRGLTGAPFPNNQQKLALTVSDQVSVMFVELEIAGDR